MYPVTRAFRAAIAASDQSAVTRVSVVLDESELGTLPFTSGAVAVDGPGGERQRAQLALVEYHAHAGDGGLVAGGDGGAEGSRHRVHQGASTSRYEQVRRRRALPG